MDEQRGLVPGLMGEAVAFEKSPFIQGFLAGVKGALLGAPAGAAVQLARGKSPLLGAIIGGLGTGLISGVAKTLAQKVENVDVEEAMRYHAMQLKAREPMIFMPPPATFGRIFSRMHQREHAGFTHAD